MPHASLAVKALECASVQLMALCVPPPLLPYCLAEIDDAVFKCD